MGKEAVCKKNQHGYAARVHRKVPVHPDYSVMLPPMDGSSVVYNLFFLQVLPGVDELTANLKKLLRCRSRFFRGL